MITENILLLSALLILCLRMEWVRRRWALGLAMVFWAAARFLIERAYSSPTEYHWGSVEGFSAIACWTLCLFSIFTACLPRTAAIGHEPPDPTADLVPERAPKKGEARLRELLHDS